MSWENKSYCVLDDVSVVSDASVTAEFRFER